MKKMNISHALGYYRKLQKHFLMMVCAVVAVQALFIGYAHAGQPGERESFNDDWLFIRGEQPGAEKPAFSDSEWEKVMLPHDWAIEGPFEPRFNARNGGLPFHGTGWYRKHFTLPAGTKGKVVTVTFDGAMYDAHVYVNGKFVGHRPFGYIGFQFDITKHLKFGGKDNVIAVTMSPEDLSTRWYPGAGIYRDTWLEINDPVHVETWSTLVSTTEVSKQSAKVNVSAVIQNKGKTSGAKILTKILDANGTEVASKSVDIAKLKKNASEKISVDMTLNKPTLWDIDNPYLYSVETQVIRNGNVVDVYTSPLGVRKIKFTSSDGFYLNDRRVPIQGVCLHHDNGPIGAVANRRAIERKLQILKSMGVNAVRTSHNPPSPIMVELADKMGILMQVESFDVWKIHKQSVVHSYNKYFDEWHEIDLRTMIKQFRNSPSVIMWSIGNEIMEQGQKDGAVLTRHLVDIAHDEDPTRLVTAGFNNIGGALKNKLADEVDLPGFNYKPLNYAEVHKEHPDWMLLATETSSITSTRGKYHFPMEKYSTHDSRYVTSYDIIGPVWAYPPDIEFEYLAKTPAVMGEYIWTGFDYLGEPTPYGGRDHSGNGYWNKDWPVRSSSFGAIDLVGFPKDRYYLYQSQWTTEPMVHVLPHWNWENMIGETIPVYAYTNAESVELFVNGKSMGKKVKGVDKAELPINFSRWKEKGQKNYKTPYRLRWDVKYQPGSLKVVAYKGGKVVAEKIINTASHPAKVVLTPDRTELTADGQDLSYITVSIEDKDGNLVPTAENKVRFFVEGAGEIAAVGNGDSATVAPFNTDYRRAFSGKAMLIVKTKKGEAGKIKVRAYSERLDGDQVELSSH